MKTNVFLGLLLTLNLFTLSAQNGLHISGADISITSGASIRVDEGDLTITGDAEVKNESHISVDGNWLNNNAGNQVFTEDSEGMVTLTKTTDITTIGGGNTTLFYNLILEVDEATLEVNTIVGGSISGTNLGILDLKDVSLDLNSNTLQITNSLIGALITNEGYLISENVLNESKVLWQTSATGGAYTIPFGSQSGDFIPLSIERASGDLGQITVSTYPTGLNMTPLPTLPESVGNMNTTTGESISTSSLNRFWQIDKSGSGTANLTFTYADGDIAANGENNLSSYRYNSVASAWEKKGASSISRTNNTVTILGVNEFSPWTMSGSPENIDGDNLSNDNDTDDDNDGIPDDLENISCATFYEDFGTGSYPGGALPAGYTTYNYRGDIAAFANFPNALNDGDYAIATRANEPEGSWQADLGDHTTGSGYMMVVNASFDPGDFYNRTVAVSQNTTYKFSAWLVNANSEGNQTFCESEPDGFILPNVKYEIRDLDNASAVIASYDTGDIARTGNWQNYNFEFNTGTSTNIEVVLINNNTGGCGNDLALDDISLIPTILSGGAAACDFDGDGIPNSQDLDSDNDGIYDIVEAGGTDADNNGVVDNTDDLDNDGLADIYDSSCQATSAGPINAVGANVVQNSFTTPNNAIGATGTSDTGAAVSGVNTSELVLDLGTLVPSGTSFTLYMAHATGGTQGGQIHQTDASGNQIGSKISDYSVSSSTINSFTYTTNADTQYIQVSTYWENVQIFGIEVSFSGSTDCSGTALTPTQTTPGTPDYLNQDSDGDACTDAKEAGFTDADEDGEVDGTGYATWGAVEGSDGYTGTSPNVTDSNNSVACGGPAGPDYDNDGILDVDDLDSDNDGILDADEATNCTGAQIEWTHNGDSGNSDSATFNPGDEVYFTNYPDIIFGSGIDETIDNNNYTYLLRNAGEANFANAKSGNDYAELSFEPTEILTLNVLQLGFFTNSSGDPAETAGLFKMAIEYSTDAAFSNPTLLFQDIQIPQMIAGDYISLPQSVSNLTLQGGTPYYFRFYFYDEQNTDAFNRVRFDDVQFITSVKASCDADGDGVPNYLDLDSDNDGIYDAVEAGHNAAHTNGQLDGAVGADGVPDAVQGVGNEDAGTVNYTLADSETTPDTIPDFLDLDSDGDGLPDNIEAQTTAGYIAPIADNVATYETNKGVNSAYLGGLDPVNTDGADTPDYLDLDADNEGDDDTTEAGLTLAGTDTDEDGLDDNTDATTDYSDPNGTIDDPTALPNVNDPGTPEVDYRDDGSVASCGTVDSDNDGIFDDCDDDDDNDGILDDVECSSISLTNTDGDFWVALNGANILNLAVGDVLIKDNYFIDPYTSVTYSLRAEIININKNGSSSIVKFEDSSYKLNSGVPSDEEYFEVEMSIIESGSISGANPNGIIRIFPELNFTLFDLDNASASGGGYTDIGGFDSAGVVYSLGSKISQYTLSDGSIVYGLSDFSIGDAGSPADNPIYSVAARYENTGTFRIKHGVFGTDNSSGNRGGVFGMEFPICPDTDTDGIPDYLDVDSDNDGCPDALEGDGSYTYADIDSESRLTAAVDGSGIPGGTSQGAGTSLDAGQQADACDQCDASHPSYVDSDGDNIADYCDDDDDNDGILDTDEDTCTGYTVVRPSDLGYTGNEIIASAVHDVSSLFGLSTGSVILTLTDAYVNSTGSSWNTSGSNPASSIAISGTIPSRIRIDHGSGLTTVGSREGIRSNGEKFNFTGTLNTGFTHYNQGTEYYVERDASSADNNAGTEIWESDGYASFVEFYTLDTASVVIFRLCPATDSDDDGIANHLDTDSDNDGCPDALEGDGSYTYADIDSESRLTATVDAAGIPGGSSQNIGTSIDDTQQAAACDQCDPSHPSYTDTDGDLIGDFCDEDDDNDGILDINECGVPLLATGTAGEGTNTITGSYEAGLMTTDFTLTSPSQVEIPLGTPAPVELYVYTAGVTDGLLVNWDEGFVNPGSVFDMTLTLQEAEYGKLLSLRIGNNAPSSTYGAQNATKEITLSWAGGNVAVLNDPLNEILNYADGAIITSGTVLDYDTGGSAVRDSEWYIDLDLEGVTYPYDIDYNTVSSVLTRNEGFAFIPVGCLDTDDDGLANNIDTDSDNDGCNDAVEAGHTDSDNDGEVDGSGYDGDGKVTGVTTAYTGTNTGVTTASQTSIDTAPSDQEERVGDDATFVVAASGLEASIHTTGTPNYDTNSDSELTYQWQVSTNSGSTFSDIAGATNASLTVSDVTLIMDGNIYKVLVSQTNNACPEEAQATLTVINNVDAINDTGALTTVEGFTGVTDVINVLDNDELNGAILNPTSVTITPVTNGPLTVNGDGSVDVASNTNEGIYTVDYQICDATDSTNCDIATVTITVAANSLPTAQDDAVSVPQDSSNNSLDVLADNDNGADSFGADGPNAGSITLPSTTTTNGGTVSVDDNGTSLDPTDDKVLFTPAASYSGADSFTYTITDANNDTSTATVNVTVVATPTIAINVVAVDDIINATEDDSPVTISGTTTNVEDGQVATVVLNGTTYSPVVSGNAWTFDITATEAQALDATETITADVTNSLGTSATQATRDIQHITTLPVPVLTIDDITSDNILNAAEAAANVAVTGTVTGDFNDGDTVTLTVDGTDYTGTVDAAGDYSIDVPGSKLTADPDSTVDGSVTTTDTAGNSGTATDTQVYSVDTAAPTIAINVVAVDDIINATEDDSPVTISGTTTNVEDGQTVTVTLNGETYTASVSGNTWTLDIPAADAQALDATETITADVSDLAGNPATQVTRDIQHITTAPVPVLAIDDITADNILNATEATADVAVTGTVTGDFNDGDTVTLTVDGTNYTGTVDAAGDYSIDVPGSKLAADSDSTVDGSVTTTDTAGNSGTATDTQVYSVDTAAPTITVNTIAGDDIINATEDDSPVTISGTTTDVEDGQIATVVLNGTTYSPVVSGNAWTFDITATEAQALDATETITADVSDLAGNPATQATRDIQHIITDPTITIDVVAVDDIINATEDDSPVAISGETTNVEDGQIVTVTLNGTTYSPVVSGNAWTFDITATEAQALDA
ncbi:Ig-like domain-containing protein, partial [Maribacter sp.]|uniref:Ig-like domain-containing protein n=1 Tax=Maribacter sp. TaxID=1897614 RepID=UPI0032968CA4